MRKQAGETSSVPFRVFRISRFSPCDGCAPDPNLRRTSKLGYCSAENAERRRPGRRRIATKEPREHKRGGRWKRRNTNLHSSSLIRGGAAISGDEGRLVFPR